MSIRLLSAALAVTFYALVGSALAQTYPSGTVRLVVPYPPGGGVDGLARPLAERLSALWGKPVIVENRAGAATIIGSDFVAKSKPDGLTLLFNDRLKHHEQPTPFCKLAFRSDERLGACDTAHRPLPDGRGASVRTSQHHEGVCCACQGKFQGPWPTARLVLAVNRTCCLKH